MCLCFERDLVYKTFPEQNVNENNLSLDKNFGQKNARCAEQNGPSSLGDKDDAWLQACNYYKQ